MILWNNPFYNYGIPNADYSVNGQSVRLNKINLEFNRQQGVSLIQGYPYALRIQKALDGSFSLSNGNVFLEIKNLKFQINSAEELFIIYEVFIEEVYRYCCLRDTVFIDIGMNSGISTLYYARDPLVKKVYSFELFQPTFLLGMQNLNLNEPYAQKVNAFNYGLSNKEFTTTLDYSLSRKGRMGLKGLPDDEHFTDTRKEVVSVKDISVIFKNILAESGNMDVVVKMDCEGEEYNLIESLSQSGLLGKLTILIIEWHYVRPAEIEDHLKKFDFHVFSQTLPSLDSGMIYASKQ